MNANTIVINIYGNGETHEKNYAAGLDSALAKKGIIYKGFSVNNLQSEHSSGAEAAGAAAAIKKATKVDFQKLQADVLGFMYSKIEQSQGELPRFVLMGHSLGAPAIARIAENLTSDVYQNMEIIVVDGLDNPGKLISKLSSTKNFSRQEVKAAKIQDDTEIDTTKSLTKLSKKGIAVHVFYSENDTTLTARHLTDSAKKGFTNMLKDSAIRATGKAQYAIDSNKFKGTQINTIRPTLSKRSKDENFKNAVIDFLTSSIMKLSGNKTSNTSIEDEIKERVVSAFPKYYDKYYNNDHRRSIAYLRHDSRSVFEEIMSVITSPTCQTSKSNREDILNKFREECRINPGTPVNPGTPIDHIPRNDEPITNEYSDIEKILSYTMRDIFKDQKKLKELGIIPENFEVSSVLEEVNDKLKFTKSAKETLSQVFVKHTLYQTISSNSPSEYKDMWQKNFEGKHVRSTAPSAPPRVETLEANSIILPSALPSAAVSESEASPQYSKTVPEGHRSLNRN